MSENWDELWKRKIEDEDWVVEKDWLGKMMNILEGEV